MTLFPAMQWRALPIAGRRLPSGFIAPCLPTLARAVPDGPRWAARDQARCYRMICRRDGDRVRVFSRWGKEWTDRVPAIVEAMGALPARSATIDGEAVVCDPQGVTDFDALRAALARRQGASGVFLYAFDLIELDGRDLRQDAWETRREALAALLRKSGNGVRLSEHLDGHGALMFRRACAMGLGHCVEAAGCALSIGALAALDQGEESGGARGAAD
jgi:bifunctional non-homologous end joining protein LigD